MPDKTVETEIFNRFSAILKEKFSALGNDASKINQLDELYKRPEFSAEKRILNETNSIGLSKGIFSGLVCFAFLRLSPRVISNHLRRRIPGGGGGGTDPFRKSDSPAYKFDPIQTQSVERPGLLFRGVRLILDSFVSLSIGAYASIYFTDLKKISENFSNIPLVEGRSLISEELCRDFTKEFQRYDRQIWIRTHSSLTDGDDRRGGDSHKVSIGSIQRFVANCRRRQIYENEIRQEQGLGDNDPVIIPTPGVPRDISVTLDDLFSTKEPSDNMGDAGSGGDFFDTYFDSSDGEGEEGSFKD